MKFFTIKTSSLLVIFFSSLLLSSCSSIVASTHNGPLVENEGVRTWGSFIDDGVIESKAKINIKNSDAILAQSRVRTISYNGILLLVGQIPNAGLAQIATDATKNIRHVKSIENQLVAAPKTSLFRRFQDKLLAGKVKIAISRNTDLRINRIKAVVENGEVYLMGLVTREEANNAISAVSQVRGVLKIVKVFEYLN